MAQVHNYVVGNRVKMKKSHPCGNDVWEILRVGADIKIKCTGENCERIVMMTRRDFNKRIKTVLYD